MQHIDDLNAAYRAAHFAKPLPPPAHLELAVAVIGASVRFSWSPEFFVLVDELLQTAQAFLQRGAKLAQLQRVANGHSKGKANAAEKWQRLKPRRREDAALYVQLQRARDPLLAYLSYRLALLHQVHLGLPIEFPLQ
jgi:hypothetical protein